MEKNDKNVGYKTNLFRLINQELWVSINFLLEKKISKKTIDSGILTNKKGRSSRWNSIQLLGEREPFIKYSTLPLNTMNRYNLPKDAEISRKDIQVYDLRENYIKRSDITVFSEYRVAVNYYWKRYLPYYVELPIIDEHKQRLCKTHALFHSVMELSNHGYCFTQLFKCYTDIQFQYNLIFRTTSYHSFIAKINKCKNEEIHHVLPHDFLGSKSNNLKLTKEWQNRLLYHYAQGYKPTKRIVLNKVNEERERIGLSKFSYSTVCDFLSRPIIKNQSSIKRFGQSYFDNNINPYVSRISEAAGDVFEMDGSQFPFLVKLPNGKIGTMDVVIVVDVFSNRIVGYSIDFNENSDMVKKALIMAFKKTGHIPAQIVHDKGSAFMSKELSTIKEYTSFWGCGWLYCRAQNPKAKGTVEKTFGTLNSSVFKLFEGYLGEGIQSRREHAHPSKEMMKEYWKKKNVRTIDEIRTLLSKSIIIFNNQNINGKESPNEKFKRSISSKKAKNYIDIREEHIALMFFNDTQKKIKKSTIKIQFQNKSYKYVIPMEHRLELTDSRVNVFYNPNDFNWIYLFDPKKDNKFICKVEEDYQVPLLSKNRSKKDWDHISNRVEENKQLKIEVLDHLASIKEEVELHIPYTAIIPGLHDKELIHDMELQAMLNLNQITIEESVDDTEESILDLSRIIVGPLNK